ncbi:MAG: lipid kinase [Candidatus Sericytochromatia bacterium]|nr:MAG: lipid kinase [Candidatus Sericytochromatia bacterium]
MSKTALIVNPKSSNGKTEKDLPYIRKYLGSLFDYEIFITEKKKHAITLTQECLKNNFQRIIAIGGDGTFNEVVNGFFENQKLINENAILGFIPSGTGSDLIKTLNIPKYYKDAIDIININHYKKIDIGLVYFSENNQKKYRYFINIADVGIGGEVVDKVNKKSKVLGGFISFLISTLQTVVEYENKRVKIIIDDKEEIEQKINNIVIGNGKFFGGGMKILPSANPFDSYFDIVIIGDINKLDFFLNIPKVYFGKHIYDKNLIFKKAKNIKVFSDEKIKIDIDGEQEGFCPAEFTIIPNILNVIIPQKF